MKIIVELSADEWNQESTLGFWRWLQNELCDSNTATGSNIQVVDIRVSDTN